MKYVKEYLKSLLCMTSGMGLFYLLLCASGLDGGQPIALYFLFLSSFAAMAGPIKVAIEGR
jgi:hypothetical protein